MGTNLYRLLARRLVQAQGGNYPLDACVSWVCFCARSRPPRRKSTSYIRAQSHRVVTKSHDISGTITSATRSQPVPEVDPDL